MIRMLRKPETRQALGLQNTAVHRHIHEGLLTQPVRIAGRAVAWPDYEIEAIVKARIAGRTDDEIRALVTDLHAARKAAA